MLGLIFQESGRLGNGGSSDNYHDCNGNDDLIEHTAVITQDLVVEHSWPYHRLSKSVSVVENNLLVVHANHFIASS